MVYHQILLSLIQTFGLFFLGLGHAGEGFLVVAGEELPPQILNSLMIPLKLTLVARGGFAVLTVYLFFQLSSINTKLTSIFLRLFCHMDIIDYCINGFYALVDVDVVIYRDIRIYGLVSSFNFKHLLLQVQSVLLLFIFLIHNLPKLKVLRSRHGQFLIIEHHGLVLFGLAAVSSYLDVVPLIKHTMNRMINSRSIRKRYNFHLAAILIAASFNYFDQFKLVLYRLFPIN